MSIDLRELAQRGPIHFMGIGGSGMSALAEALVRSGARVTGCDSNPASARAALSDEIELLGTHDVSHVEEAAAVVVTSAVPAQHPELEAARARGIPVLKRAQALGAFVNSGTVLAVAGTHGKTTTTALTTAILEEAGLDPTAFVGGRVEGWGGGLRSGESGIYVVEADEFDRSFLTLQPSAVVVTSVEADHLDIYGSIEAIYEAFRDLLARVPQDGVIALCVDDAGARTLATDGDPRILRYGTGEAAELRAEDVVPSGRGMRFRVTRDGRTLGEIQLGLPGLHNVRNTLGAVALALHVGADFNAAVRALVGFRGVARRFQDVGTAGSVTIIDDYAHHPTEVAATLDAARAVHPKRRVVAVFQPHLYSRTRDLAREFGEALARADEVWVTDVFASREQPIEGVTGELVASAARSAGATSVRYVGGSLDDLVQALCEALGEGDVCVGMGAGDIDSALRSLLARLSET